MFDASTAITSCVMDLVGSFNRQGLMTDADASVAFREHVAVWIDTSMRRNGVQGLDYPDGRNEVYAELVTLLRVLRSPFEAELNAAMMLI